MSFTDKSLHCMDCGSEFTFSASEQELFANKGYQNEPKRCPACRAARRSQRGDSGGFMGAPAQTRQMWPAVCATCGQETQVPFEPRSGRPVYCSACYVKTKTR
ncbi:MAG: zinc-ribbon domain containing protein [Chloroflexi bacterium]|nr:zinc-ribbon domain containing protein [Chloroflexota bacterium]